MSNVTTRTENEKPIEVYEVGSLVILDHLDYTCECGTMVGMIINRRLGVQTHDASGASSRDRYDILVSETLVSIMMLGPNRCCVDLWQDDGRHEEDFYMEYYSIHPFSETTYDP